MSKALTPELKNWMTTTQKTAAVIWALAWIFGAAIAKFLIDHPEKLEELKINFKEKKEATKDWINKWVDIVKWHAATAKSHVTKIVWKVKAKLTKTKKTEPEDAIAE